MYQQPDYYHNLANVGDFTKDAGTELLVAVSAAGKIAGKVVFFREILYYGSGGTATEETNACGFRLLAVDLVFREPGIGKLLSNERIKKAKTANAAQVITQTTAAMQTAWKLDEALGFRRSEGLDFMQGDLPVYRLRLKLE